ncbi:MAG: SAM-dependent methyltransferase [Anaerolineae bacterium]
MQVGESFAGVVTAATRVVEMYQPEAQRLFDDPLAYRLLPFGWRLFLRLAYLPGLRQILLAVRERRMPGSLGSILCRTRYLDDVLRRSLAQGLDQVVILGAGFDTRAYRIDGMDSVRVFEVDLPGWRQAKQARLEAVLGAVPANVSLVGIDFDRQDLGDALSAAGFRSGERTLFIWEGVTQYLTASAVSSTLAFVSGVSGDRSSIVFTYVRRGIVDGSERPEWMGALLSFASKVGSPMTFGLDQAELPGHLAERGLSLVDDVGATEYQARYLQPVGRKLSVFDGERAAFAVVAA